MAVVNIAIALWQLPQHILGLIVLVIVWWRNGIASIERLPEGVIVYRYYRNRITWGVSLGPHIFLSLHHDDITVRHEYGHSLQSRMLGPLYLVVVGIPSFVRATWWWIRRLPSRNYYGGYPEAWADRLGGVRRR